MNTNNLFDSEMSIPVLNDEQESAEIDTSAGEEIYPESVTLIASGYDWICPRCETFNHTIETAERVTCGECGHTYEVDEAIHAEG